MDDFYNDLSFSPSVFFFLHDFLSCVFCTQAYGALYFRFFVCLFVLEFWNRNSLYVGFLKIVYKGVFLEISLEIFDILTEKATEKKV